MEKTEIPRGMKESTAPFSSMFAESVAMVTVLVDGRENAMPATWAIPVSFSPPLLAVNIAPQRHTHDMIKESRKFGISLLADDQAELSRYAGSCSGRNTDKFKELPKFYGATGAPLIPGAAACFECELVDSVTEGDHSVFTGKVISQYVSDKLPLLLFSGKYFSLGKSLGKY